MCVGGVEGPGKGTVCEALSRTTIILQELLRSLSGQIALQVSYLINIDMRGGILYPKNSNNEPCAGTLELPLLVRSGVFFVFFNF